MDSYRNSAGRHDDGNPEEYPGHDRAMITVEPADASVVSISGPAGQLLGAEPGTLPPGIEPLARRIVDAGVGQRATSFRWQLDSPSRAIDVRVLRITRNDRQHLLALLDPVGEAHETASHFSVVSRLLDSVLGATDFRVALATLLRHAAYTNHWCYAEAWVPVDNGAELRALKFHWADARFAPLAQAVETRSVAAGEGILGTAWSTGVAEWLAEIPSSGSALPHRPAVKEAGLTAACVLPIRHEERVICVLAFYFQAFDDNDRQLFEMLLRFAGVIGMVLARSQVETALGNRDALMQSLFSNLPCSVYRRVLHADGHVSYPYVGGRLLPAFGIHSGSSHASTMSALSVVHPEDRNRFVSEIYRSAREGTPLNIDYRVLLPDGSVRWLRTWSMPGETQEGDVAWDCFALDITEERRLREQAEEQSRRDAITRLPTREVLEQRLGEVITKTAKQEHKVAVLLFNIDRFRWINDAWGMAAGDALLAALAERLQETLPENSLLARLASDEFALVISALEDEFELRRHLAVLQRVMHKPFKVFEQEILLTYTSGLCLFPDDTDNAGDMLRLASLAMHRGRRENKGKLTRFQRERDLESASVISMERELRNALREKQIEVHYQPQVTPDLQHLTGFEALVRWRHPEQGMVPPNRFIPVAEESGLIDELFLYVLDAVSEQYAAWQADGLKPPAISVNLSPVQMRTENHIALDVARILARHTVPPACLKLEITEGTLLRNFDTGLSLLNDLGQMGVAVVLDDFGVGYSSLGYLAQLPVRSIKVDRSFVKGLEQNVNAAKVLRAVITLAHSLGMDVLVEGVETEAQLDAIRQWNCHGIQGYFFSKPLPADETTALMERMRSDASP